MTVRRPSPGDLILAKVNGGEFVARVVPNMLRAPSFGLTDAIAFKLLEVESNVTWYERISDEGKTWRLLERRNLSCPRHEQQVDVGPHTDETLERAYEAGVLRGVASRLREAHDRDVASVLVRIANRMIPARFFETNGDGS